MSHYAHFIGFNDGALNFIQHEPKESYVLHHQHQTSKVKLLILIQYLLMCSIVFLCNYMSVQMYKCNGNTSPGKVHFG